MLFFKQVPVGNMDNFSYIAGDSISGEAAVIDMGWTDETDKIIAILKENNLDLKYILCTHCHYDHTDGIGALKKEVGGLVAIHESEKFYLDDMTDTPADIAISDNSVLKIGDIDILFIHTPGHSPGSCCIKIDNKLLTGDTLFIGSIGRTDFPGSDPEKMFNSLQGTIGKFDDDIEVFPGHNYGNAVSSTIGKEKKTNQFLQIDRFNDFKRVLGLEIQT